MKQPDPLEELIESCRIQREDLSISKTKLGQGGFGIVWHGTLTRSEAPQPMEVAVKQLYNVSHLKGRAFNVSLGHQYSLPHAFNH